MLRSKRFLAAGVNEAAFFRGVHDGGGILPPLPPALALLLGVAVKMLALWRMLFLASPASRCERLSRDEGCAILNGVVEGPSPSFEMIRGVDMRVPMVMSCFTAFGPSSAGVGEGRLGTREKESEDEPLGRSKPM